jgi:hypothetical protein
MIQGDTHGYDLCPSPNQARVRKITFMKLQDDSLMVIDQWPRDSLAIQRVVQEKKFFTVSRNCHDCGPIA